MNRWPHSYASSTLTGAPHPTRCGANGGLSGAFTLLEFDGDLPDLLYLDPGQGERATIIPEAALVSEYAATFESLHGLALNEDDSIEFVRTAAEEML